MRFALFAFLTLCAAKAFANGGKATVADIPPPCQPAWLPTGIYNAGNQVSVQGINYQANWWTQGDNPVTHSGAAGSGKPWAIVGNCQAANQTTAPTTVTTAAPTPTTPTNASAGNILFTAYKDVAISANWNTSVISTDVTSVPQPLINVAAAPAITWAFATGECGNETWGGISPAALAGANVQAWAAANKPYILSTGGASGTFTCGSDAGFSAFLDRYLSSSLIGVDFDIEGGQTAAQIAALVARVKTAQANPRYNRLSFSFTIATLGGNAPSSLSNQGVMVMQAIRSAGLARYSINLMAMDYGAATPANCTQGADGLCAMGLSANQAAINLHQAYNVPYAQIELTPMIGGNDTQNEVFGLADVDVMVSFAKRMGLAGVHFWSLDRDTDCAPGSASPTCNSYGKAGTLGFTQRFAQKLAQSP